MDGITFPCDISKVILIALLKVDMDSQITIIFSPDGVSEDLCITIADGIVVSDQSLLISLIILLEQLRLREDL